MAFTLPALPADTKPFLLGALAGALAITWTGFDALGWTTSGKTESLAARRAEQAVLASHARICAAQFNAAKDSAARLAELQKVDRYQRGNVIAKTSFATMAGEKEAISGASQACADLLLPEKP